MSFFMFFFYFILTPFIKKYATQVPRQLFVSSQSADALQHHARSFVETLMTLNFFQPQVCPFSNIAFLLWIKNFISSPASVASSLPYIVNATILGQPWTIMEGNGCDQLPCPTSVGQDFTFAYRYTVSEIFPPVRI